MYSDLKKSEEGLKMYNKKWKERFKPCPMYGPL